ncbi:Armadillo-type fold domain containing protein [Akanthomyces lecanii RCEF 1005]|uniref:Pumilio homology domain family member 3 n=2 Tax=Akanthomyces TaxID=150366 RepID=A0A168HTY5_CORDF|nr:Armadillo-type fold domain containing protein [Akanthomyces lecanii RCEF 1005]
MPTGPNDKAQQPLGSGFPGSNLYPNKNIWNASIANGRERSSVSKESDESPTGSSALNANSEADVWSANPWNNDHPSRSVSTSPNRAREAALANGAFFDHSHAAIGVKKSAFDADGFAVPYPTQKRAPHDPGFDALAAFAPRDQNLPPSRQSQGSPAFADLYHAHGHSNSIHSQRGVSSHGPSLSTANQRAFNYNTKAEDDLASQFARRMNFDQYGGAPSFNPASQPFQLNPGSQPWMADNVSRYGSGLDYSPSDAIGSHVSAMKRGSIDRISPSPTYRLESGNSPRGGHAMASDVWGGARPSSRDPRTADIDRRAQSQQFPPAYPQNFYGNQYPYGAMPPQYAPNFMDPYSQNFRHPLLQNYGIPPLPSAYAPNSSIQSVRPSREQDPSKAVRSFLLEEFRQSNKSNKRYELKDIYNHVVEFSGDQHGSRFIQQKLETANSDEKEQVFREIEPNAIQLMKDVFGNYVVQKFFEHGNQVQKKVLAEKMRGKVVDLSVQVYACRVVQKAFEHVLVEQQAELTKELDPEILRVIRDQNGNHVIQKIIELVPRQYIDFIMDALRGQVTGLASHTYGCRVIQRMLEYGTEADKLEIMTELHASSQILITDQYGNYVAQHVIQNGKPEDRDKLIQLVMSQLLTLSKHKFASNVVEKCIEHGTPEQRSAIREQLTTVGPDGTSPLQLMMRDQYGNYVIQKLLGQLHGAEKELLVEEIKPQFFTLKKNGASRQLQALEKLLGLGSRGEGDHSATPTPALTNETSSPQTSSPPSTHVSAVSLASADASKKASSAASGAVKVHEEEA